jgi:hypothetical protein
VITALDPATVRKVRVELANGAAFELRRSGGGWNLTEPLAIAADPFRVQALLGALRTQSHAAFPAADGLSRFGLDPPRVRLVVDGVALAFGDTDPIEHRRYVLYDGEVHLVTDAQYPHLTARAENFAHPSPLGPGSRPVRLVLPGLTLERVGSRWEATPERPDLGADVRNAIADAWANARALRVSPFAPDHAWTERIEVSPGNGAASVEMLVATSVHEVLIARPDLGVQWHFVRRMGDQLLGKR